MYSAYKYTVRKYQQRKGRRPHHSTETPSNPVQMTASTEPVAAAASNGTIGLSPDKIRERKRRRLYRWKVIFGLWGPFALQSLDTTIIASSLPFIASDFDEVKQLNWIVSAFNLTSAAFMPFWAQLADIFGRHPTVQAAILVMFVGSALCTGATIFPVLLLGRALQGVAAAGINISIRTILADRVSLSDYAINWTFFIIVSGVSFSCGPIVGGYLTQTSWRWCFAINLPVAVVAIVLVFVLLRGELLGPQPLPQLEGRSGNESTRNTRLLARLSTLDYGGQLLFLLGLGLLSLALTWGGGLYPWNSAAVLAPLAIGGVLSVCWIFYERSMSPGARMARIFAHQSAMMPWDLLSQRDIALLFYIAFTTGIATFAVFYFMDLYFVLVEGRGPGSAGISLLPYLWGAGPGALMGMLNSNLWPRQTLPMLLLGSITSATGIAGLAWAVHAKSTDVAFGMMALVGHGSLIRMNASSLHALAYFPAKTAQTSCLLAFAMPFGGLVGLTIMSTIFTNKSQQGDAKEAIMYAFIAITPFMGLGILATTFLGNVWLLKDGQHEVVHEAYLWGFISGKRLPRERIERGDVTANAVLSQGKEVKDVEEIGSAHNRTGGVKGIKISAV